MAASTVSLAPTNSTDALFRTWVAAVIAALTGGGFVQTADTGQINTSTVLKPATTNTKQGYVILRSNDAAGGLHNFYIKLSFGSGSNANTPSMWFQFGWGSDGSGNLTGNTNTEIQVNTSGNDTTALNANFGVGTGWFSFCLFSSTGNSTLVNVERVRNTNGAETDDLHVYGQAGTNVYLNQVVRYSGTHATNKTVAGTGLQTIGSGWRISLAANDAYATNTGLGTIAGQMGGYMPDSMGMFCGSTTNYTAAQSTYSFNVYGASHTYILNGDNNLGNGSYRVLTRYE